MGELCLGACRRVLTEEGEVTGLYISIPFCPQKCTYCNFASGVFRGRLVESYLEVLQREIRASQAVSPVDSVYFGGGTPSLLETAQFESIIAALSPVDEAEITIEASPLTITVDKVCSWAQLGVNRVSLGVQSFVPREAVASGRKHTPEDVSREITILRAIGIENINIDLIAGLAYQDEASWEESLDWLERLQPPHVSVYMLEADDESRLAEAMRTGGARFSADQVPSEDQIAVFYERAVERLENIGIERYEISNFAASGSESRHNLKYWNIKPYIGFGSDAHSFDGRRRWQNVKTPNEYIERAVSGKSLRSNEWEIDAERRSEEKFITGLRQMVGVCPTDSEWRRYGESFDRLHENGWLSSTKNGWIRLTSEGVMYSNEVFQEFLVD